MVSLLIGLGLASHLERRGDVTLLMAGVALQPDGAIRALTPTDRLRSGSRAPAGSGGEQVAAEQQRWLRAGTVPTVSGIGADDLVSGALLDLHTLGRPYGVVVAGWGPAWRYVWPRDAAFTASALARTGHLAEARRTLDFLQSVQGETGEFAARYTPDTRAAPDGRGVQLDGTGWALWALGEVAAQIRDPGQRRALARAYRPLLDSAADAAVRLTATPTGLPPASPDYWEVPERRTTLATCGVLLAGLRRAESLYGELGAALREAASREAADRLEAAVLASFAPAGFPRRLGGSPATVDLGVSFLLPPFAGVDSDQTRAAWRRAPERMARPAGGLAPGGSWRRDGVSWTPTVATYAMVAACVDPAAARHWLRWLAAHRTATGALPEKVRADGAPASVAPLAWTAAAVVIAADQLERGCAGSDHA